MPLTIAQTSDRAWTGACRVACRRAAARARRHAHLSRRRHRSPSRARRRPNPTRSSSKSRRRARPAATASRSTTARTSYAISQQMVIVKTERLLGRRAKMPADEVQAETLDLAAEQRQVRAEFVFMMGGELADAGLDLNSLNEEVEAAGEDDLAAGRLANQGRLDILRAIRSMSRAASRLADGDAAARAAAGKGSAGLPAARVLAEPLHPAHAQRARAARSVETADGRARGARPRSSRGRRGAAQPARRCVADGAGGSREPARSTARRMRYASARSRSARCRSTRRPRRFARPHRN